jgi:hypothetical protein
VLSSEENGDKSTTVACGSTKMLLQAVLESIAHKSILRINPREPGKMEELWRRMQKDLGGAEWRPDVM